MARLSRRQEEAVAALLGAPSIAGAAAATKISESTLKRWLKEPAFQQAYSDAKRDIVEMAKGNVAQAFTEAVMFLRQTMNDTKEQIWARLRASEKIVDTSLKIQELEEILSRVEALEARARQTVPTGLSTHTVLRVGGGEETDGINLTPPWPHTNGTNGQNGYPHMEGNGNGKEHHEPDSHS